MSSGRIVIPPSIVVPPGGGAIWTPDTDELIHIPPKLVSLPGAWSRDAAVAEMVRELDERSTKYKNWSRMRNAERFNCLSKAEYEAVIEQASLCAEDFTYAARNYFWITDNDGQDRLMTLWESQYLILQKYYELKRRGIAQKIFVLKARQLGACLDPDTKVLTGDLRWVRIDDVKVGADLVSVDEYGGGRGSGRKMRRTTVLARNEVYEPAYKILLDNGKELIATGEHRFLCRRRGNTVTEWRTVKKVGSKKSSAPIRAGDEIRFAVNPWESVPTYEDGWFGGMLDGEGSLRARPKEGGVEICVAQVLNEAHRRAKEYLNSRGYTFHIDMDNRKGPGTSKLGDQPVAKLVVNRINEVFRLVGQTRPARFIGKDWWEGRELPEPANGGSWPKVLSVEPMGLRRMVDLQTSTKTFFAEGFVSHNSTLVEAMIAWRTMFFPNINALVISVDAPHAAYVFGLALHIYDRMPWWLQPEYASREEKQGIWFQNPYEEERATNPGLDSHIYVQWAGGHSGLGQGRKILGCHVTELTDWYEPDARKGIEGDLKEAVKDSPEAFWFVETTGKESGSYSHRLWRGCEDLSQEGEALLEPLFLPWFFETTRRRTPPPGWSAKKPEISMREKIKLSWARCDSCGQYCNRAIHGRDRHGEHCPSCSSGKVWSVVLGDDQMYWKEVRRRQAEKNGREAVIESTRELASTAEESFLAGGISVFPLEVQERVMETILDPDKVPGVMQGYFDTKSMMSPRFHGLDGNRPHESYPDKFHCYLPECTYDHTGDLDMFNVTIWEKPLPGRFYSMGVDFAEGLGQNYSVIFINKFGLAGQPDEQVAVLRDNRIDTLPLSFFIVLMGYYYNTAMFCGEYEGIGKGACDAVMHVYQYPNIFRWHHMDQRSINSNKWHWYTKPDTRQKLWQTTRQWLRAGSWIIRSKNFLSEMQTFQKDEDEDAKRADHAAGSNDDELFAGMIALYAGHEGEADERGVIHVPMVEQGPICPRYLMTCQACGHEWGADNPEYNYRCPRKECQSVLIIGKKLEAEVHMDGKKICDSILDQLDSGMPTKPDSGQVNFDDL